MALSSLPFLIYHSLGEEAMNWLTISLSKSDLCILPLRSNHWQVILLPFVASTVIFGPPLFSRTISPLVKFVMASFLLCTLLRKNLCLVAEGFELQRIAAWVKEKHRRLLPNLVFKADIGCDDKVNPVRCKSLG